MSEKIPSNEEVVRQSEIRIEEAKNTASEFVRCVEHAFDGFPSEGQWQAEFKEFLDSHSGYELTLQNKLLNSSRDEMKAELLEDLQQFANSRGMGGLQKAWLAILKF